LTTHAITPLLLAETLEYVLCEVVLVDFMIGWHITWKL